MMNTEKKSLRQGLELQAAMQGPSPGLRQDGSQGGLGWLLGHSWEDCREVGREQRWKTRESELSFSAMGV